MAYAKDGRTVQSKKPNTSLDTVLHQRLEKINNYNLLHEDKEPAKVLPKNTIHKAKKLVKPFEMRVLPVVVLVGCLLLVIKVPNIYQAVEIILTDTRVVAFAEAQENSVAKPGKTKSVSNKKINIKFIIIEILDTLNGVSVFCLAKKITENILIKPNAGNPIAYITIASLVAITSPKPNFPLLNKISTIKSEIAKRPTILIVVKTNIKTHDESICVFIFSLFLLASYLDSRVNNIVDIDMTNTPRGN